MTSKKSCYNCLHLVREEESWEMPHIYWYECSARPQNSRLKQFPFRQTECSLHKSGREMLLREHGLEILEKCEEEE